MAILVTGAAGFIGFHTARALLMRGGAVVGLDNVNAYYDVSLKEARLAELEGTDGFTFERVDLKDADEISRVFETYKPDRVIHLAAQAGVRYGMTHPRPYVDSNIMGFLNILEACRYCDVRHLIFASSSSVYGANRKLPFSEQDAVDHPVSFYAATKKSNEMMAHAYAHLFDLSVTGLRFFTVYGPWGRPDMALFKFAKAILADEPIDVFHHGKHSRDFTYVDDVVDGIVRLLDHLPQPVAPEMFDQNNPAVSDAPYRIYNIGNHKPVPLMELIACLERALGKTAKKNFLPMQPGDVPETYANIDALSKAVGFSPSTPVETGVERFVEWYLAHYHS